MLGTNQDILKKDVGKTKTIDADRDRNNSGEEKQSRADENQGKNEKESNAEQNIEIVEEEIIPTTAQEMDLTIQPLFDDVPNPFFLLEPSRGAFTDTKQATTRRATIFFALCLFFV